VNFHLDHLAYVLRAYDKAYPMKKGLTESDVKDLGKSTLIIVWVHSGHFKGKRKKGKLKKYVVYAQGSWIWSDSSSTDIAYVKKWRRVERTDVIV